jgi:UDP-N-acetylmuramate--alanine ligase
VTNVGAGLAPARAARTIRAGERIHVVGIAGAGASAAAILAARAGAQVSGCDPGGPSPYTDAVEAAGIPIAWQHAADHVTAGLPPDRLAVTKALTAVDPDHPELRAARDAGIPVESWQQVIADAAAGRRLIGVAGTHGKSTTSGWLVHTLVTGGQDPCAFVGALLPPDITGGAPATARWGAGHDFIVEADEYAGNFDAYQPEIAILTSAEWDHPDVFADADAVAEAFAAWLRRAPDGAILVANAGDPGVESVLERLWGRPLATVRYAVVEAWADGVGLGADITGRITAADAGGTTLEVRGLADDDEPVILRLATAGRHNAANALAVAGAARAAGLDAAAIARGLASFTGVGRRLERTGDVAGVVVYDDYAHHPTAIRETLRAIRQREPERRVWAVYEPLTYHRTAALLDGFADALVDADAVAIADIWAGRDSDTTIASAQGLADAVSTRRPGMTVAAPGSVEATAAWLAHEVRPGDAVLVMGGGRSYRIGELLLESLATKEPR